MKNKMIFIVSVMVFITNVSFAQAFKFGTITADVGVAGGFYVSRSHFPNASESNYHFDLGGSLPTVDAEFGLLKFLGVGVHYSNQRYTLASIYTATGSNYGVTLNFHIANKKDKFDLPIGITYGRTSFKSGESVKFSTDHQHIYGTGTLFSLHILPHIYFGKYVGMFLGLEYTNQFFDKTEWLDVDGRVYSHSDGFNWKMDGLAFRLGVAGRFPIVKSDK